MVQQWKRMRLQCSMLLMERERARTHSAWMMPSSRIDSAAMVDAASVVGIVAAAVDAAAVVAIADAE
jgi:hypothetical protein